MSRRIFFDKETRAFLQKGADTTANAVKVTLGPKGRNVVISRAGFDVHVTKDGVTVANEVYLPNPIEHVGAQMIKEIAQKTAEVSGDGTTTSCVLAQEILSRGLKAVDEGANPMELKRGIDKAVEDVVANLKAISTPIDDEKLVFVATIAANNDAHLGTLIGEAFQKIGKDGQMTVRESKTSETKVEYTQGFSIPRGFISPMFINNTKLTAEFDNARILITDKELHHTAEIAPILDRMYNTEGVPLQPLVIFCNDMDGEALATLIVNKTRNKMPFAVVKMPFYGDARKEVMRDIATLTGSTIISEEFGFTMDKAEVSQLGSCSKITIGETTTVIIDGAGDASAVRSTQGEIELMIQDSQDQDRIEFLKDRLARLLGRAAVLMVGAKSETEMREKKDRVDDAIRATKAAIEEGYVPGGGTALVRAKTKISNSQLQDLTQDERLGYTIILLSCGSPLRQIALNCGVDGSDVFNKVWELDGNVGYNAKTGTYEDLVTAGVIDPTKVVRVALENAASVAGLMLTSECLIVEVGDWRELPEKVEIIGGLTNG